MATDKRDNRNTQQGDVQTRQAQQTENKTGSQQPASPNTPGPGDSSYDEALKHVGHRGGKTTDFGSTSYEEDAE